MGSEQSGDRSLALDDYELVAFPEAMHDLGELGLNCLVHAWRQFVDLQAFLPR
jgi:hypothetical protein